MWGEIQQHPFLMNKRTRSNILIKKITATIIVLLIIAGCRNAEEDYGKIPESKTEVWFKQTGVDLGTKIKMIDEENGLAISRGKGEDVKGKVLRFSNGKWTAISEHDYSDFPFIAEYKPGTIWWLIHETHRGKYKPRLFSFANNVRTEMQLPAVMWDNVDYAMWTAVSILPNGKAWMVGQQGNIAYYDGLRWKSEFSPVKRKETENFGAGDLHDIQMTSENSGWAIGKKGVILRYKNGKWNKFQSPTEDELKSISMLDEDYGWIVGDRGTILKYENGIWKRIENNIRVTLNAVKVISKNKVWIAGARSTLLEYTDGNWIENKAIKNFEDSFISVDVIKAKNGSFKIWVIGDNGVYTNSQSFKFSFTDITSNVSLRKEGRAAIFRDFDNDGLLDLTTILEDGPPVMYVNQNNSLFSEVARDYNSQRPGIAQTISSADFDNDGNTDLLEILDDVNNKLSFGTGGLEFRGVDTHSYIHPKFIQTDLNLASVQTADFDNDGNLDLYFSNYNLDDMLFKNNGVGKFEDVFEKSGINKLTSHRSYGATLSDFNCDGLIDVLLTYKLAENNQHIFLFINKGNFRFEQKDDPNFFTDKAPSTYASISNDFNNDGIPDLVVFNQEFNLQVLLNDGKGNFTDVAASVGFAEKLFHPEPSGGVIAAADVNNDGWLDLFLGSRLFLNSPQFKFSEVGKSVGVDFTGNPTFADFDNDGDMDLFIGSSREALGKGDRAVLYRNNLTNKNFLRVKLLGDLSNRNAIGAKVYLQGYNKNEELVYKTIRQNGIGSNTLSQEDYSVIHFGVNPALRYKVEVLFPSGTRRTLDAEVNKTIEIRESSFLKREIVLTQKSFERTLKLIELKTESIKFFVMLLILLAAFLYAGKTKVKNLTYHVYIGIFFLTVYLFLVHLNITKPQIEATLISIGGTTLIAFGFVFAAVRYTEIKESKYVSHFKLLELIGEGGMGKVYKAVDKREGKTVAIKILNPHLLKDEENKRRLASEGRLLSTLNHPNIVKVLEFGETEQHTFVAMEYLSGGTLHYYVEKNYPLEEEKVIQIAKQICSGLQVIHSNNIIHRDLKSQNIMLDGEENIRIMDFGLSKSPLVSTMTTLGTVVGTLGYVAPEQVTNINVDQRVDIFSFGVIMYQMLTNKLPFSGENEIALIHSIFNTIPQRPSEINNLISPKLETIILKCLEKSVDKRFQTVREIIDAMEERN
jgi:RIO-like serine/threonine protein kinase